MPTSKTDSLKYSLLETMKYFHELCERHELNYFLVGGTLLGAVRHKGFIPWDDDLDVVMPRTDYERFLKLHKEIKHPFQLQDYSTDRYYRLPFAKLANTNFVVQKNNTYIPIKSGVWLDIFPLDYTFTSTRAQSVHYSLTKYLRILLAIKTGDFNKRNKYSIRFNITKLAHSISQYMPRAYINSALFLAENLPGRLLKQNNYINLYGAWGVKETAPVSIFEHKKLYDFEGYKFWSIENADFWLSKVYGDYMKLPPLEKRNPKHFDHIIKTDC